MATTSNIPYPFGNMVIPAEGGPSIKAYHEQEMEKENMDTKDEEAKLEIIRREEENRRLNLLFMGEKEVPLWSLDDERKYQKEKRGIEERQRKGKRVQGTIDQIQDVHNMIEEEAILIKATETSRFSTLPLTSLLNQHLSVYASNSQGQTSQNSAQKQLDYVEEYGGKRDMGDNFGPYGHNSQTAYQQEVEEIIKETKHIFALREKQKEKQTDESDRFLQSKDQTEREK